MLFGLPVLEQIFSDTCSASQVCAIQWTPSWRQCFLSNMDLILVNSSTYMDMLDFTLIWTSRSSVTSCVMVQGQRLYLPVGIFLKILGN